jgi:AcrR family transcriptional regulator
MSHASDARTRILDAAEAIVRGKGVSGLTLDAAAREAGVSKGGLLYHFASKEALLSGLLARLASFIDQDFETSVAAQPEGPGRVARAILNWAFGLAPEAMNERCDRAAAVFLAAFHHDPALLDPIRAVIARIRAAVDGDGLPPGHGGAILAASDGLFMARIFGLYAPTPQDMTDMHTALRGLLVPAA